MMKIAGLILLLLVAAAATAQTNQTWTPCRYPLRAFGSRETVNLTPLFQWWQLQPRSGKAAASDGSAADTNSDRPLSAWQRITGTKAGEAGGSWVINAVIFTSPTIHTNARIFLNNPPITEEQTYYVLKAQLAQTDQQLASAQHAYQAHTKAAQQAEDRLQAYSRAYDRKFTQNYIVYYTKLASQEHADAAASLDQQKQLEAARPQLEKQLKAIPARNGSYYVDWFAMAAGATKKGVPIYDLGVVNPNSP